MLKIVLIGPSVFNINDQQPYVKLIHYSVLVLAFF